LVKSIVFCWFFETRSTNFSGNDPILTPKMTPKQAFSTPKQAFLPLFDLFFTLFLTRFLVKLSYFF